MQLLRKVVHLTEIKARRGKLGTTASQDVIDRATEYGNSPGYAGLSNFVENALSYYMGALNREKEIELEKHIKELEAAMETSNKELEVCKKEIERLRKGNERHTAMMLKLLTKYPEIVTDVNELERQFEV